MTRFLYHKVELLSKSPHHRSEHISEPWMQMRWLARAESDIQSHQFPPARCDVNTDPDIMAQAAEAKIRGLECNLAGVVEG
jgi:hypothetical protein